MNAEELLARYKQGQRDFRGLSLCRLSFEGQDLSGCNFEGSDLRGTNFRGAILDKAVFIDAVCGPRRPWRLFSIVFVTATTFVLFTVWLTALPLEFGTNFSVSDIFVSNEVAPTVGVISYFALILLFVRRGLATGTTLIALLFTTIQALKPFVGIPLAAVAMWVGADTKQTITITSNVPAAISKAALTSFGVCLVTPTMVVAAHKIAGRAGDVALALGLVLSSVAISAMVSSKPFASIPGSVATVVAFVATMAATATIARGALRGDPRYAVLRAMVLRLSSLYATNFSKAHLKDANFTGASLRGVDLSKCDLTRTNFFGAQEIDCAFFGDHVLADMKIQTLVRTGRGENITYDGMALRGVGLAKACLAGASFKKADLTEANLRKADLRGVCFRGTILRDADLRGAILSQADLSGANLCGANLRGANLHSAVVDALEIDVHTYQRSKWSPEFVFGLAQRRAKIIALDLFPIDVQDQFAGCRSGLTLVFDTRLTAVDRFLVDGIIFAILGRDTDCRVVEFREGKDITTVRLAAAQRSDLECVAEALYRRIWEQHERALVKVERLLGPIEMLSDLQKRLERMELRVSDQDDVPAWTWDLRRDHLGVHRKARVYFSFAPEDEDLLGELEAHLSMLRRQGVIDCWNSGMLLPGQEERDSLGYLDAADIVVPLVSADLLKSVSLIDHEMARAMARYDSGQTIVVPVLVRHVDITGSPLERMRCLPENRIPVKSWLDRDAAWKNVADGLRRIIIGFSHVSP